MKEVKEMISAKMVAIAVSVLVVGGGAAALVLWPSDDGGPGKFWPSDDDGPGEGRIAITDDRGKTITFENPPERIMSLGSSFTDTLAMLGCMDNIFAVDQSSVNRLGPEYPELSSKEVLSSGAPSSTTADLALLYGIDCIIVWNFGMYSAGMNIIESVGIKVIALYPTDIESVKTVISTIGKLMDKDVAASELIDDIDTTIENITALATAKAGASYGDYKRVYIELDAATPTSPPKGSITGSMLDILGVNYIGRSETASIVYDVEDIKLVFQPDIVIFMGPVNGTPEKMKRIDDLNMPGAVVDVYHDGNGFNGNWASATPSFIKGLVYLYELIYAETYTP